jgi:hypothetical protein
MGEVPWDITVLILHASCAWGFLRHCQYIEFIRLFIPERPSLDVAHIDITRNILR